MSEQSKHTPGPWKVDITKDGGKWAYNIRTVQPHNPAGGPGKHIATVNPLMQAKGEDNAHLIAAAPDLLEACLALLDAIDAEYPDGTTGSKTDAAYQSARAAIARAEGGAA